jgi:hypothetical protein
MSPLLELGTQRPLETADLYPVPQYVRCAAVTARFETAWASEIKTHPQNPSLYRALKAIYLPQFLLATFYKFLSDSLSLASPQLMSALIAFVGQSQTSSPAPEPWIGIVLAISMFISASLQTILTNAFQDITRMSLCTNNSSFALA